MEPSTDAANYHPEAKASEAEGMSGVMATGWPCEVGETAFS